MIRPLLLAFLFAASAAASAQALRTIAYQGYLTTTGGVPVNASVEMQFAIYSVPVGGTPVWTESQAVPVSSGAYSVVLGASEPLPNPLTPPLFLGVRIGSDDEAAPRQAIAAAPFALFAESARCNPGDIIGCSGAPGSINVGACVAGKRVCNAQGTAYGPCEGQQDPTTELCDNIDNDCDGQVDENFPNKGTLCTVGLGACLAAGTMVCSPNGSATECNATPGVPSIEVCNGIDDNCDGAVDNGATCSLPNAQTSACLSPQCVVISCVAGFFNCDGNHANGCETVGGCP